MPLLAPDKIVRQAEAGECGLASLAMIARRYGDKSDLSAWRRRFPLSARGSSLKDLVAIADQMGFHTRALKCDIPSLSQLTVPAILHWDLNHYVVLDRVTTGVRGQTYRVLDPASGERLLSDDVVADHFTGIALEVIPSATFQPNRVRNRLRLTQLWTRIRGLAPALLRIAAMSIIMQAILLAVPFYTQIAIDSALPSADFDLLNVLLIGFVGLLLLNGLASWMRNLLILDLNNSLGYQTAVNLFRHTIFLPIAWFEKRHLGDVTSRFGSLQPINDLLSRGLVGSIVDGMLALTTFSLMMIYSSLLTGLTVGIVCFYIGLRIAFFRSMKFANANILTAQAIETSTFIENIRGISAIKTFCQEGNRQRHWQNKKADFINGSLRLGKMTTSFDAISGFVISAENLLFVYFAIHLVLGGAITLGMVFAVQAYKQSFVGAVTRLVDQVVSYRLLDVHLDRISDIALEEREPLAIDAALDPVGRIDLENVSFSYGYGQPFVLKNVSLTIEPGKTTILVGPSGSGKTTLFKILCGLLRPTTGRMLVDGVPLDDFGVRRYRSRLGVVCQEDTLFSGSLAENIAFFDPDYATDDITECAKSAHIHHDIMRMPMKYETAVGDMGSSLSGGQRQRLLLARALYQKPDVLMLDEGTAHLDINTEERVINTLRNATCTQVLVAHRPETIRAADVIYQVVNGNVMKLAAPMGARGKDGHLSMPV